MAKCVWCIVFGVAISLTWADDRIYFNEEDEKKWNTPPELTSEPVGQSINGEPQARFLPFSATFSLSAGSDNAHSLSVGGSNDGISLSQSASQADGLGLFGNTRPGLSASQSSSFSAGLSGISASDANAFNLNHPIFGGTSKVNSNSFSLGDAHAGSHGNADNGQASTGAHSGIGSSQSGSGTSSGSSSSAGSGQASSAAEASAFQNQGHRQSRPIWTNFGPNSGENWSKQGTRPVQQNQNRPTVAISGQAQQIWPNNYEQSGTGVGSNNENWPSRSPNQENVQLNVHNGNNWPQGNGRPQNNGQSQNCGNNIGTHRGVFRPQSANYYNTNTGCGNGLSGQNGIPTRPGTWSHNREQQPGTQISAASASSGSSSTGNGFSFGQSSSQSNSGPNGPSSSTTNHVQTSGNAQGFSQGASAAVGQTNGQTDASFSSGSIFGSTNGNGQSMGTSVSGNRGQNSKGQVTSQSFGQGTIVGTGNAGSVSFVKFPEESNQNIPSEFVRNRANTRGEQNRRGKKKERHPVDAIITEITDSVADLFDI